MKTPELNRPSRRLLLEDNLRPCKRDLRTRVCIDRDGYGSHYGRRAESLIASFAESDVQVVHRSLHYSRQSFPVSHFQSWLLGFG